MSYSPVMVSSFVVRGGRRKLGVADKHSVVIVRADAWINRHLHVSVGVGSGCWPPRRSQCTRAPMRRRSSRCRSPDCRQRYVDLGLQGHRVPGRLLVGRGTEGQFDRRLEPDPHSAACSTSRDRRCVAAYLAVSGASGSQSRGGSFATHSSVLAEGSGQCVVEYNRLVVGRRVVGLVGLQRRRQFHRVAPTPPLRVGLQRQGRHDPVWVRPDRIGGSTSKGRAATSDPSALRIGR